MQKEITFGEVAEQWKQSKREVVKHTTLCAYMLILKTHLLPRFGEAKAVAEADVQQFIFDKLRSGLSRSTVHDMVAVLKAVMKYGARHRLIHSADWELVYPTDTPVRRLPVLSLADHRKLLNAITDAPSGHNIGVLLALCAGLRIGEVCALRWKDIDLSRRIITVGGTLCRVYNCDKRASEIFMSTPKTRNSHREIPIPAVLYDALCRVKRSQRQPVYVVGNGETAKEPRTYREIPSDARPPRHPEHRVPRPSPHLCHTMHRERLRLQDGKRIARPLQRRHNAQPVCPPLHGAEKAVHGQALTFHTHFSPAMRANHRANISFYDKI